MFVCIVLSNFGEQGECIYNSSRHPLINTCLVYTVIPIERFCDCKIFTEQMLFLLSSVQCECVNCLIANNGTVGTIFITPNRAAMEYKLESTGYSALPSPPTAYSRGWTDTHTDAERHNTFSARSAAAKIKIRYSKICSLHN